MIGVEMVENSVTRKPMEVNNFIDIWERCKDMGVLFGKGGINGNVRFYLYTKFDLIKFNFHLFLHPRRCGLMKIIYSTTKNRSFA